MDENERRALKILVQTNQTLFLARKSNKSRMKNFKKITDVRYDRLKELSIDSLEQPLSQLYEEINSSLKFFSEYEYFLSNIKELNIYDSASLIIYIGNVSRFKNKKHLISYSGLSPVFKKNGKCFKPKKYNNKGICISNKKIDNIDYSEPLKNTILRCTQKMINMNPYWKRVYDEYRANYQKKNPKYTSKRLDLMSLKKTTIKFLMFIFDNFKIIQKYDEIDDKEYQQSFIDKMKEIEKEKPIPFSSVNDLFR